ncbi:tetratricopeptide repeat-containing sulfotransferase family protein [soil metagenome]
MLKHAYSARQLIEQGRSLSEALCRSVAASHQVVSAEVEARLVAASAAPTQQEIDVILELFNQGRFDQAEMLARDLCTRFPRHGFGWNALGAVLLQSGRSEEALEPMQKAAYLLAADPDAHNNLGTCLHMLGRITEAEACFRRTLKIKPDFTLAHNNLGSALQEQGRFAEAETNFDRAIELDPAYADAHYNLGTSLSMQGQTANAERCYRRTLEINPGYGKALVALGVLKAGNGQFEAAEEFFQRAIAIDPGLSSAWSAIAGVRKMTREDEEWVRGAQKIAESGLEPRQASRLHFSIGKYYDDVGEFAPAFENYRRANDLSKRFSEKYDRQRQTRLINHLCHAYDQQRMQMKKPGSSDSARPVFIVGMPRSGTSLAEQILASHPSVFGAGELDFWPQALVNHMPAALGGEPDEALLGELTTGYLDELAGRRSDGKADVLRVVDKMPVNFLNLGLILTSFPNARVLHTMRNPIDTCLSIYFQNFSTTHLYANDLDDLAHYYREYHRMMTHWRAVLPTQVFLDIPYESLVGDQENWSRKMIDFIGLEWDPRCLDFHQTERSVRTASQWQVRQEIYSSSVERWRNYEKFIGPLLPLMELET